MMSQVAPHNNTLDACRNRPPTSLEAPNTQDTNCSPSSLLPGTGSGKEPKLEEIG